MFSDTEKKKLPPGDGGAKPDPAWAWAPYKPDAKRPWDLRRVGHLLRRAGFGANWGQLQEALRDGPERAVDKLLRPQADVAAFNRAYDELEGVIDPESESTDGLRGWWLRRMIETPHPLLEKMTLFWHEHFAISRARAAHAPSVSRRLQLVRANALGRFAELLHGVVYDPATLVALDAAANRKAQPSLSFARVFLDLLTVGPGHYSEGDVRDVARAFTGVFVVHHHFRYFEREHDDGPKKILGREGPWTGHDAVKIALAQPSTARLVVAKLYRWLISETAEPGDNLLAPLAESFAKDYDIGKLVGTVLRSNWFFSPAAYRRRIKSPVEFAVGIVRGMETLVNPDPLGHDLAEMGQDLCHPPTVKGWAGGATWITESTLIRRNNLAWAMLSGAEPYGGKLDPWSVARKRGHSTLEKASRFLIELYLQGDLDPPAREQMKQILANPEAARGDPAKLARELAHAVVTLPEFQLA
jgi:uncharacterized protein (DUF1800 family)